MNLFDPVNPSSSPTTQPAALPAEQPSKSGTFRAFVRNVVSVAVLPFYFPANLVSSFIQSLMNRNVSVVQAEQERPSRTSAATYIDTITENGGRPPLAMNYKAKEFKSFLDVFKNEVETHRLTNAFSEAKGDVKYSLEKKQTDPKGAQGVSVMEAQMEYFKWRGDTLTAQEEQLLGHCKQYADVYCSKEDRRQSASKLCSLAGLASEGIDFLDKKAGPGRMILNLKPDERAHRGTLYQTKTKGSEDSYKVLEILEFFANKEEYASFSDADRTRGFLADKLEMYAFGQVCSGNWAKESAPLNKAIQVVDKLRSPKAGNP